MTGSTLEVNNVLMAELFSPFRCKCLYQEAKNGVNIGREENSQIQADATGSGENKHVTAN